MVDSIVVVQTHLRFYVQDLVRLPGCEYVVLVRKYELGMGRTEEVNWGRKSVKVVFWFAEKDVALSREGHVWYDFIVTIELPRCWGRNLWRAFSSLGLR
jgi:hypothetical protein